MLEQTRFMLGGLPSTTKSAFPTAGLSRAESFSPNDFIEPAAAVDGEEGFKLEPLAFKDVRDRCLPNGSGLESGRLKPTGFTLLMLLVRLNLKLLFIFAFVEIPEW